jgi:preprotein translocase subunit SecG
VNMSVLVNVILAVQILAALGMIGLILVQHGKGADMGAAFGSGSSGSLFGASGSANFLSRTTAVLAAVFFITTWHWLTLAIRARPARAVFWKPQPPSSLPLEVLLMRVPAAPVAPASGAAQIPSK